MHDDQRIAFSAVGLFGAVAHRFVQRRGSGDETENDACEVLAVAALAVLALSTELGRGPQGGYLEDAAANVGRSGSLARLLTELNVPRSWDTGERNRPVLPDAS
ncbi:MAG: hypothetical protein ACRDNK_24005 [Solirubrobacteraceae bacterium]